MFLASNNGQEGSGNACPWGGNVETSPVPRQTSLNTTSMYWRSLSLQLFYTDRTWKSKPLGAKKDLVEWQRIL